MGCTGCSVGKNGTAPQGCGSKGSCLTGGCNRLNTYDWLAKMEIEEAVPTGVVEVSFKNGARKSFYYLPDPNLAVTGDMVVVESNGGYDIGQISLSGELVRLQMKKKRFKQANLMHKVVRRANPRDLERLDEARASELKTMIRARAIARTLDLDMKIGDVEFQGDRRKATFYYTADGRVDFRELIRHFAKEFRVKVEMRQIGARQESARIGGLGSCGRELCCSTWLTDFKSVSTAAARYQNLAINQAKLSGQCGRLKCCLNYELDTYMDALQAFPKNVDKLRTKLGTAVLIKTDIFKGAMFYYMEDRSGKNKFYELTVERVWEIKRINDEGELAPELVSIETLLAEEAELDFEDVTGAVELPPEERRKRRRNRNKNRKPKDGGDNRNRGGGRGGDKKQAEAKKEDNKQSKSGGRNNRNRRNNRNNRRRKPDGQAPKKDQNKDS